MYFPGRDGKKGLLASFNVTKPPPNRASKYHEHAKYPKRIARGVNKESQKRVPAVEVPVGINCFIRASIAVPPTANDKNTSALIADGLNLGLYRRVDVRVF